MRFDFHTLPIPDFGLRCRTCGYALAGLPSHVCPECGKTIRLEDYIPPGDYPLLIFGGEIVKASDSLSALLKRYEIPVLYHQTRMEVALGPIERGRGLGDVCVPRESYFEAIDLMRRQAQGEAMPSPPERATEEDPDWTCAGCDESNPATFEICWNCERERGNTAE